MPKKNVKGRKGPSVSEEGAAALLEPIESKSTPSTSSSSAAIAAALMQAMPSPGASASSSTSPPRAAEVADKEAEPEEAEGEAAEDDEDDQEFEDRLQALLTEPVELDSDTPPISVVQKDTTLAVPTPSRPDWDSELKAMQSLAEGSSTPDEEKVQQLHEALQQIIDDVRATEEHGTLVGRCFESTVKERDACNMEKRRVLAVKAKLEASCRELQGMKKTITQETKKIVAEEEGRQNDLNEKFTQAMKDVDEKMEAEKQVREHFIKENEELRGKLEKFVETYEAQEKHLAEQVSVRAKEMEMAQERLKEYNTKAGESKVNASRLEKENKVLLKSTTTLREQLQNILGKFDDFQESVTGSNQKHGECKSEIDMLQSKFTELETENIALRNNDEFNQLSKQQEALKKQKPALDKLCGNLAQEIEGLRERLKGKPSGRGGG